MDRICRQRGGNAVYGYFGIVRMTTEAHRYSENRFDYRFLNGFDVHADSDFRQWWNPKSFPWETNVIYLIKDFNDKFETWWDEEKLPWGTKFLFGNISVEEILIRYCVAYFPIWYCTDYFQLTDRLCDLLKMHCGDFKDIWAQDYLLYKLAK